jgi:D-alanine-D-alanine ligase
METKRTRVVLLFGGRSAEHEVSILSARSVAAAAPKQRFEIVPVCIAKNGRFLPPEASAHILEGAPREASDRGDESFSFELWSREAQLDVILPLVHGTHGEDGALQGYLEILGLPYIGSGVAQSAAGMDKVLMKQAFAVARLPLVDYVALTEADWRRDRERERVTRAIINALRLPYFVKPANGGSSVGVTKVKNDNDLRAAIETAFRFDEKIIVERGVDAREIEVAVLGNDEPETSVAGEIITSAEFYDYHDKYVGNNSSLVIPARLKPEKSDEIRKLAVTAFKAINASGFSRVDFFLERGTNRLYLNEINTIPGFTSVSMYPKLWEATEMKYPRLVERLIDLGIERSTSRLARRESAMRFFDEAARLS